MSSVGIMVLRLGKDNLCRGEDWVRLGVLEGGILVSPSIFVRPEKFQILK